MDSLFGGHLLSSVVCDECRCCMQRLEAFLDLSLPIVDDESSKLELEESFSRRQTLGRSCKKKEEKLSSGSKKSAGSPAVAAAAAVVVDDSVKIKSKSKKEDYMLDSAQDTSKLSKHQQKKMVKLNKKATKLQVILIV